MYHIVGSAEAEPSENKLSNESPVGSALLGHKRGDTVTVQVPRGPSQEAEGHEDRGRVEGPSAVGRSPSAGPRLRRG